MSRSHLKALCAFASYSSEAYYIQSNSQLNTLSIDINIMEITLWSIECLSGKFENFLKHFLNMDISLNRQQKLFVSVYLIIVSREPSLRFFYLGLSLCFMKSRKLSFKN